MACDNGTLFGSVADEKHLVSYRFGKSDVRSLFTESASLFAVEPDTGKMKWKYKAVDSIRHNAIPAFSPDSRRVVYSSDLHGVPAVYIVEVPLS